MPDAEKLTDVRAYEVTVQGYPPMLYSARSAAKARSRAWRDYQTVYDCSFKDFMKQSRVTRAVWADGQHKRVMILGKLATIIIHPHRRDQFMYDGSDVIMVAHHSDIKEMPNPPLENTGETGNAWGAAATTEPLSVAATPTL